MKLASRKYEVVYFGVILFASSDLGNKVKNVVDDGSTVIVMGTRKVNGMTMLLTDRGWASSTDADGDIQLKAVSEIDKVALLIGVKEAAASIGLLNADYGRLNKSSVAIDFQEFLKKIHVADIVKSAD